MYNIKVKIQSLRGNSHICKKIYSKNIPYFKNKFKDLAIFFHGTSFYFLGL
ncbi:hypothetical protein Lalb_Chr05g0227521 [Lupinus albus]|uniref:Uncharacterized protein n=1 Tax=Lupinus albus TaxID=3870 RepID=A0A6A4QN07_LUPAL|nr:hypothetical protein Lalb_Chr05g0227521 [Lupinus albus]